MPADTLVGWRLWRLGGRSLCSWGLDYRWRTEPEPARCLAGYQPCSAAPGRGCRCGYWALRGPRQCVRLALSPVSRLTRPRGGSLDEGGETLVMGLVRLWGEVAVHGGEGYRAERATPICLFLEDPQGSPLARLRRGALSEATLRWLERRGLRQQEAASFAVSSARASAVARVADRYGIPALGVDASLRWGFLSEVGVEDSALRDLASALQPAAQRAA